MAYTFLKAQGYEIGTSLCEDDRVDYAKEMIAKAEANGVKFLLPVDHRIAANSKMLKLSNRRSKHTSWIHGIRYRT